MTSARGHHIKILPDTARPRPYRGVVNEIYRWACWVFLRAQGWRLEGDWPTDPKLVILAAPHTANWDGVLMMAAVGYYRTKLSWMGKKALGKGLGGRFLKAIGCIPIDRKKSEDVVAQMVTAFEGADRLMLCVPPEGTRAPNAKWKSGFYHIAKTADVPMLITILDYGAKRIRLSGILYPGESYSEDLAIILSHYEGAKGRNPENFLMPDVLEKTSDS